MAHLLQQTIFSDILSDLFNKWWCSINQQVVLMAGVKMLFESPTCNGSWEVFLVELEHPHRSTCDIYLLLQTHPQNVKSNVIAALMKIEWTFIKSTGGFIICRLVPFVQYACAWGNILSSESGFWNSSVKSKIRYKEYEIFFTVSAKCLAVVFTAIWDCEWTSVDSLDLSNMLVLGWFLNLKFVQKESCEVHWLSTRSRTFWI